MNGDDTEDIETWCDEHLPDLYDEGMFDSEEIHDDVWEEITALAHDTVLDFLEDEDDRDALNDTILEAAEDWLRAHHTTIVESLPPVTQAEIAALCARPQMTQHSAEWQDRRFRLSASEFKQILDGRRGALMRQKLDPLQATAGRAGSRAPVAIAQDDGTMNATSWGHRFEPIVRRIYEEEIAGRGTVCDTLGSFRHPTIPWISASPDGLVMSGPLAGRLVEIKAPKTRQPGTFVPDDYFVQMQVQMEVCDLEAVDFVEAQFCQKPVDSPEVASAAEGAAWKGRIQVWGTCVEDPDSWRYVYSDVVEDLDDAVFPEPGTDLQLLEDSVWWLTGWYPRTVLRNRTWWDTVGSPQAQLFWMEVESLRAMAPTFVDTIELVDDGGWMGR